MFHVILYQPEIPPNTGNIIRLCANAGCLLHLIEPLGFELDRRSVRRAGLDYAEIANVQRHGSFEACRMRLAGARLFVVETDGATPYSEARISAGDALLFGPETRGVPASVRDSVPPPQQLRIPMCAGNRSLNLANAVAIVVYEGWRQNGFELTPGARAASAPGPR